MVVASNHVPLVLVGGFGFIGRNILDRITHTFETKFRPLVIDNLSNACPGHETLDVASLIDSYTSASVGAFLDQEASAQRTFIFLAGETRVAESRERPMDFVHANIMAPSAFVHDHVRAGDTFILVSTAGALYDGSFAIRTESAFCPKNFYGATKAAEELILEKMVELKGAQYSVVRMTNVYGRYSLRKKSAIHVFTRAIIDGSEVQINGDGGQTRDFIFAGDIARGIMTVIEAASEGRAEKVNLLGQGRSSALNDIIDQLEAIAGKTLNTRRVPATALLATEPRDVTVVVEDVRRVLGNDITSLEDGLRQTYAYYQTIDAG